VLFLGCVVEAAVRVFITEVFAVADKDVYPEYTEPLDS
jgi:hypothetical protein